MMGMLYAFYLADHLTMLDVKQIGSRITSKHVSQMLEEQCLSAYILVNNHPRRHDPSHLVTHRIQSSIMQFSEMVLKSLLPHRSKKWCNFLQVLNSVVLVQLIVIPFH